MLQKVDLQSLIRTFDEGYAIDSGQDEIDRELFISQRRKKVLEQVIRECQSIGIPEEEAETAVTRYFSGLNSTTQPTGNLLLEAYVSRGTIARKYGIPTLTIAASSALLISAFSAISTERLKADERSAESGVEQVCAGIKTFPNDIQSIQVPVNPAFESDLTASIREATALFLRTQSFEEAYCGNIAVAVTQEDLSSAIDDATYARQALEAAQDRVKKGQEVIQLSQRLSVLPARLEQAYAGVKTVVKDETALNRATSLYAGGKAYIATADVPKLEDVVDRLSGLESILNAEYTLRIVSREGVKSGIDRYYTDKDGKRISGFYLIVEAIDLQGNATEVPIQNQEEGGKVYLVNIWGEQVPKEVYERVKADKQNDGIIQESVVGRKEKGFLDYTITMKGSSGNRLTKMGQITRW